jgi:hypothetical protein
VNAVPGRESYIAPCWQTGAGMSVAAGAGPFFQASASIARILNFDKIQWSNIAAETIKCKSTGEGKLLMTLYGYTCAVDDFIDGANAAFQVKAAATANFFGEQIGFPCTASDADGSQFSVSCPYDDTRLEDQCLGAKLPGAKFSLALTVPFQPYRKRCKGQEYDRDGNLTQFDGESGYFDFTNMDVRTDFALDDAPILLFPESNIIPGQFQDVMQTAMMEAANTDMKEFIRNFLNNKVQDLIKSNKFLQSFLCMLDYIQAAIPPCVHFQEDNPIDCSGTVPKYPNTPDTTCSPCDKCCLCLQNGDCGPVCTQDCPCIRTWCTESGRTTTTFDSTVALIAIVILAIAVFLAYYFIRGLKRPILPLWFPLVET